ncbi:MAG: hypothetical protein P8I62_00340, partial [Pseudomonadales bacterium]|nr:hypothetical protein [Pseudomonadales bacterium]
IIVAQVLRQLREQGLNAEHSKAVDCEVSGEPAVTYLLNDLREAIDQRFGKVTLKDIIDSRDSF